MAILFACNNEKKADENKAAEPAAATTETKAEPAPAIDPAAMDKAMKDFATPGKMHEWLASFNGTWNAEVIGFMDPTKPDTSKATQTYSMTLNGLYQDATLSGNMMGMPFEGRSMTGFDNSKKIFVSTWVDNLGSGIIYMTGTYDETTKTLNLKGSQTNPVTGKDSGIREVMRITDANNYILEMYGEGYDGKEAKFMEAKFSRKK
jgi:hypothetical protein